MTISEAQAATSESSRLAWKTARASERVDAQASGWVRFWDGWPLCAVCYEDKWLAEKGRTRDTHNGLNETPERRVEAGAKCCRCSAEFPANSRPWMDAAAETPTPKPQPAMSPQTRLTLFLWARFAAGVVLFMIVYDIGHWMGAHGR